VRLSPLQVLAKFVPAAAVKRIGLALFIGTRLKELQGGEGNPY